MGFIGSLDVMKYIVILFAKLAKWGFTVMSS